MSSDQAKNFHSITIGEKNTWDDWHLVPSSRPLVVPPAPKTSYADVVAGDGSIDLTTALTSKITYANRSGSWEFIVINPGQIPVSGYFHDWTELYSAIMAYLHGKSFEIVLDDDPNWYYTGRVFVSSWSSDEGNSKITIGYNLEPYKRLISNPNTKRF